MDGSNPAANFSISRDGGQTWTFTPAPGKPDWHAGGKGPRFAGIHNAIVQLADGCIMAFGRFDLPAEQEKFNYRTPVSYSSDMGNTWTYEASEFPAIAACSAQCSCGCTKGRCSSVRSPMNSATGRSAKA